MHSDVQKSILERWKGNTALMRPLQRLDKMQGTIRTPRLSASAVRFSSIQG
jgi:hypothetical protein